MVGSFSLGYEIQCFECGKILPENMQDGSPHYCSNRCNKRANNRRNIYGIGRHEFMHLLEEQGRKCKICHSPIDGFDSNRRIRATIDHCHKTGVIRGLLCLNCNAGLGHFRDDMNCLSRAIKYLRIIELRKRRAPAQDRLLTSDIPGNPPAIDKGGRGLSI